MDGRRSLTDTFTGIMPAHAIGFVIAELARAIVATLVFGWLLNENAKTVKSSN